MASAEALRSLATQLSKLVNILNKQIEQHDQSGNPPAKQRATQSGTRSSVGQVAQPDRPQVAPTECVNEEETNDDELGIELKRTKVSSVPLQKLFER